MLTLEWYRIVSSHKKKSVHVQIERSNYSDTDLFTWNWLYAPLNWFDIVTLNFDRWNLFTCQRWNAFLGTLSVHLMVSVSVMLKKMLFDFVGWHECNSHVCVRTKLVDALKLMEMTLNWLLYHYLKTYLWLPCLVLPRLRHRIQFMWDFHGCTRRISVLHVENAEDSLNCVQCSITIIDACYKQRWLRANGRQRCVQNLFWKMRWVGNTNNNNSDLILIARQCYFE